MGDSSLRILLLDGDPVEAGIWELALEDGLPGSVVTAFRTAAEGLQAAAAARYDVVVAGTDLPDAHGIDAVRMLRRRRPDWPVIVVCARGAERLAPAALSAGAADVLSDAGELAESLPERVRAVHAQTVGRHRRRHVVELAERLASEHSVQAMLNAAAAGAALALDADGASVWLRWESGALEAHLGEPLAAGPHAAESLVGEVVEAGLARTRVLDPVAIGPQAYGAAAVVCAAGVGGERATLVVARHGGTWDAADRGWLEHVAHAILDASVRLLACDSGLRGGSRDRVTGLAGSVELHARLEAEAERGRRHGHRVALLLIDLPDVARLRATGASAAADGALRVAAQAAASTIRRYDVAARLPGDRLAVLLPQAGLDRAAAVAARVCDAVQRCEDAELGRLRAVCGLAGYPDCVGSIGELLRTAEEALLVAGRGGGGQVVTAPARRHTEPPAGRW